MNMHMRKIQEKRIFPIGSDEFDRLFHIPFCQGALIRLLLYHFISVQQRQRRIVLSRHLTSHIVAVRQAVILIKAVIQRQELFLIAAVPLSHDLGAVSGAAQDVRYGGFRRMKPDALPREQNPLAVKRAESNTGRITPGQHSSAGRRTDGGSRIEIRKPHAVLR